MLNGTCFQSKGKEAFKTLVQLKIEPCNIYIYIYIYDVKQIYHSHTLSC